MTREGNNEPVSVLMWMFIILLTALPCIGLVFIVVFAFVGKNETKKNYFRALIVWFAIWLFIMLTGFALGLWPELTRAVEKWISQSFPAS